MNLLSLILWFGGVLLVGRYIKNPIMAYCIGSLLMVLVYTIEDWSNEIINERNNKIS